MDVKLPKQLREQLDHAAAITAEITAGTEAPVEGNTEVVPEVEPVVEEQPAEQPKPVAQPKAASDESDVWEQKFRVLQGKYQAEVPLLHEQIREMSRQIADLTTKHEESKPAPVAEKPIVAKEDEDAFGSDLMHAMSRVAESVVARALAEVDKRVDAAVKPVAVKQVQSDKERFWNAVDASVPDFAEVNADQRWAQYLNTRIVGTPMTYRQAAESAISACDASALVEILQAYKQTVAPAAVEPAQTQAKPDLAKHVAPTGRRDSAPSTPQARIWTGPEYEAALDPRNKRRMDDTTYKELVASAEQALAEGRVRW